MAAAAWSCYDQFLLKFGKKLIDLSTDTIKCAIFTSSTNAGNNALSPCAYSNLTNEYVGTGYTAGGVAVAATWANASGTETFDVADPNWSSAIPGYIAVIYDSSSGDLICWSQLDTTPATVTFQNIVIDSAGVFTLARA